MSDRVILRSVFAGSLATVIATACNVASQAVLVNSYGGEVYGIWALAFTLTTYSGMLNLAIPTATVVISNNSSKNSRLIINNALLLTIAIVLTCFAGVSILYVTDSEILSWGNPNGFEGKSFVTAIYWGLIGVFLRFPIQILISDFNAQHNQVPSKIYDLALGILTLICAIATGMYNLNFDWFYMLYALLILPAAIFSVCICIRRSTVSILSSFDLKMCTTIVKCGIGFLILGLPVSISPTIDNLLLSRYNLVADISSYAFSSKIFIYIYGFVNLFSVAFFGIIGSKSNPDQAGWVQSRIWFGANFLSLVNGLILLAICCFFGTIYFVWTGGLQSTISFEYILTFALYVYTLPMVNILSSTLSGMNLKRGLIAFAYLEIIVHVALSYTLIPSLGLLAVPVSLFFSSFVVPYILLPSLLKSTDYYSPGLFKTNYKLLFFSFFPAVLCLGLLMNALNMNNLSEQCVAFVLVSIIYLSGSYFFMKNDPSVMSIIKTATSFYVRN